MLKCHKSFWKLSCSCKTTATVQGHYKSVPICTLNKSFIRTFPTLLILSHRFVFCWPHEQPKVTLMWQLTVSVMPLVSSSRYFHVPYFEGITICWDLFPWILLKVLCLTFLPSIFCLCRTLITAVAPLCFVCKSILFLTLLLFWGGPGGGTENLNLHPAWKVTPARGGEREALPCPPSRPQQLPAADALGEECRNKSDLQLWWCSSSVWQSAV